MVCSGENRLHDGQLSEPVRTVSRFRDVLKNTNARFGADASETFQREASTEQEVKSVDRFVGKGTVQNPDGLHSTREELHRFGFQCVKKGHDLVA